MTAGLLALEWTVVVLGTLRWVGLTETCFPDSRSMSNEFVNWGEALLRFAKSLSGLCFSLIEAKSLEKRLVRMSGSSLSAATVVVEFGTECADGLCFFSSNEAEGLDIGGFTISKGVELKEEKML